GFSMHPLRAEPAPPTWKVAILPLVSADSRTVTLHFQARLGEALFAPVVPAGHLAKPITLTKTASVADGATVLIHAGTRLVPISSPAFPGMNIWFGDPGCGGEEEQILLLATAHLRKTKGNEQKAPGALPPLSPRTAE